MEVAWQLGETIAKTAVQAVFLAAKQVFLMRRQDIFQPSLWQKSQVVLTRCRDIFQLYLWWQTQAS